MSGLSPPSTLTMSALPLAVAVPIARNNTLETLRSLMPGVLDRLAQIEPRTPVKVID